MEKLKTGSQQITPSKSKTTQNCVSVVLCLNRMMSSISQLWTNPPSQPPNRSSPSLKKHLHKNLPKTVLPMGATQDILRSLRRFDQTSVPPGLRRCEHPTLVPVADPHCAQRSGPVPAGPPGPPPVRRGEVGFWGCVFLRLGCGVRMYLWLSVRPI